MVELESTFPAHLPAVIFSPMSDSGFWRCLIWIVVLWVGGFVSHGAPPEALPDYGEVSTHPTDIDSTAQGPRLHPRTPKSESMLSLLKPLSGSLSYQRQRAEDPGRFTPGTCEPLSYRGPPHTSPPVPLVDSLAIHQLNDCIFDPHRQRMPCFQKTVQSVVLHASGDSIGNTLAITARNRLC